MKAANWTQNAVLLLGLFAGDTRRPFAVRPSVRLSFDFSFGLVFRFFHHPPSLLLDQHSIRVFLSIMSYATGSTKQSPVFSTQCNLVARGRRQAASGARRHLFAFLTPLLCNIITSIIFSTIQTKIYSCSRCLFFGQTKKQFSQKALRLNV